MDDSTEGSGKGRGIALKKYVVHLISRRPDHDIDIRMGIGSFDRITNFTSAFLNQSLASIYMWLPLFLTAWAYFSPINRQFLVVGGYFCVAVAFFFLLRGRELGATNNKMLRIFAAYVLMIAGSIVTLSSNVLLSLWFLFAYVGLPFLIGMRFFGHLSRRSALINYSLLIVVMMFVFIDSLSNGLHGRAYVFGSQANSIQLSLVCAFVISFVLFDFRHERVRHFLLSIFTFFGGLLLGGILPRWFILATLLMLFLAVYLIPSGRAQSVPIFAFVLGWIAALFLLNGRADFYGDNLVPRFAEIQEDPHISLTSIEERVRFILTSIELFLSSPFFGVGVGNFGVASGGAVNSFPHLSSLHVLTEMGVIALILYLIMIGYAGFLLVRATQADSSHFPLLAIFLYGIVFSFLHGNYLTDKLVYVALGYAASHGHSLKRA